MIAGADLFFGIRLHSTILSTCIGIPSLTFYYVPKGKSYFKQIGIPENSFPVESLLSAAETKSTLKQFDHVIENEGEYRRRITLSVSTMKSNLLKDAEILKTIV
jgi:polysaccharide pyruvyl transferase WcaK-like protein